ncbi:hypothetical protein BET03_12065 [Thermohalobacter berrensis]|uniref:NodB homology domain-containing protein n=2 Tax=Thermohalobacter berrensis TaxID=99594 RepID=A0A419T2S5_9FIRM|nr:hypothetical protein BET03_12065 [Thermohalobacter berrensis]
MKVIVIFLLIISLVGCTGPNTEKVDTNNPVEEQKQETKNTDKEQGCETDNKENEVKKDPTKDIDLSIKPNEAGQIMVLMYHHIGKKEDTWVRTVENFKKDLKVLYEKGYRPISLKDFVNNNIHVEAGYTPVVITFDDGRQNNFNIIEKNGELIVDPNCAAGIMEEFHKKHPDFPLEATFFVFGKRPFGQKEYVEYKLKYLIDKGFDIGNHTIDHNNFSNLTPEEIQRAIAKNVEFLNGILPDYEVNTLALPYGSRPKNKEYEIFLRKGEYDGVKYENIAILNVGWKPSVSPIDKNFNPYSIHRVRASEMNVDNVGMYDWLEYFDKYPEKRFISDGNPDVITVPKKYENRIDKQKLNGKFLYLYDNEKNLK